MKIVIQRVENARVSSGGETIARIGNGLLLLVGIHWDDEPEMIGWAGGKILKMRIFDDADGRMNRSVTDTGGEILVVSQFTLLGDPSRGNRPGYSAAAAPDKAEEYYQALIEWLRAHSSLEVGAGSFGSHMSVELTNDGPVTIILEK